MTAAFTILGPPRTKNTGRITPVAGGRRCIVLPTKQYRAWFRNAQAQYPIIRKALAGLGLPIEGQVRIAAVYFRDRDAGDLDNYHKGLGDFLQRVHIIANDKLIASWDGSRLEVDRTRPRVEVEIEVL